MLLYLSEPRTRREVIRWGRREGQTYRQIDEFLSWLENEGHVVQWSNGRFVAVQERAPDAVVLTNGETVVVMRVERVAV